MRKKISVQAAREELSKPDSRPQITRPEDVDSYMAAMEEIVSEGAARRRATITRATDVLAHASFRFPTSGPTEVFDS